MVINGVERQMANQSVSELIKSLNLSEKRVVVEVNGTIVDRDLYHTFQLDQNHVVEIVGFVGGG